MPRLAAATAARSRRRDGIRPGHGCEGSGESSREPARGGVRADRAPASGAAAGRRRSCLQALPASVQDGCMPDAPARTVVAGAGCSGQLMSSASHRICLIAVVVAVVRTRGRSGPFVAVRLPSSDCSTNTASDLPCPARTEYQGPVGAGRVGPHGDAAQRAHQRAQPGCLTPRPGGTRSCTRCSRGHAHPRRRASSNWSGR